MTNKSNFTPDEWKVLWKAQWRPVLPLRPPNRVGCGVF